VGEVFPENAIFRIDHYLGKETVQNLLILRFANTLLEPLWNSGGIDHVQITVAESLGAGKRASYYDRAAPCATWCRTTCSSCLCLVAMEPPEPGSRCGARGEAESAARPAPDPRGKRLQGGGARPV
jgi:glucose-6-phosphate 1-dehydrogenase